METEYKFRILSNILKTPILRNFLITSLVIVAIIPFYSVFYSIPSFNRQLTATMEDEAIRTASHLGDLIIKGKTELTKDSLANEIISEINRSTKNFRLERIKIFSKQGEIIFSTAPEEIGKTNKSDYFQNIVAKGNVYTALVRRDTKSLEGRIVKADVVETYVPLLSDGEFIGAIEIYYDMTKRKEEQRTILARTYTVLFAIVLIFLIAVIALSFKASKNIIERERAEKALRESEERFRTLSDKTPLGMSLIGIDGRYEYVNPAFVKIFGYDLSDIPTGKEWFRTAFPDPEYRREAISRWKEDLESYQKLAIRPRSYEVRCKGGASRIILFRPVTMLSGKQLIIYEDITDRKRAEEALEEERKRLQQALDEVKTLRGIIPICSYCKKIRDDTGYWNQVEQYIGDHTDAEFSHGICPSCYERVMKELKA